MTVTLLLLGVLAAFCGWWLLRQGIVSRPWLETGPLEEASPRGAVALPAAKIGLGVFIGVASALMALLLSAYAMRTTLPDWSPPPQPRLLWVNTAVLVLASLALQRALRAAQEGDRRGARSGLLAGGVAGLAFVLGQLAVWRQLAAAGYLPASNPADAFFYLITAVHGLHLLGGLVALGRTGARLRKGVPDDRLRLSLELCTTYWHFLLLVWIVLFFTLAFAPSFDWLVAFCTAPFR
jgi:cytochrome c oxidase subunit 3